MNAFLPVMLASLLACSVTTAAIVVISRYEAWAHRYSVHFTAFAAGILISISFLHIIPESIHMDGTVSVYLLAGFFGLYLSGALLGRGIHNSDPREQSGAAVTMLGIGFHSFIDGVIYSVTFNTRLLTGIVSAVGMVFHEFPEGIITFVLLHKGGYSRRRSAILAFLIAALSTPAGTFISFPFVSNISRATLAKLLAASAGALVYLGASHLLPEVEKEKTGGMFLSLGAGLLVAFLIHFFIGSE